MPKFRDADETRRLLLVKVEIVVQMAELCGHDPARRQTFMALYASLCALQTAQATAEIVDAFQGGHEAGQRVSCEAYQRGMLDERRRACAELNLPVPAWVDTLDSELRARDLERRDASVRGLARDCDSINQQVH